MAGGETKDTVPEVLRAVVGHPDVDAVIMLGVGIQSNQGALERNGPFYPEHGLERIVAFHERQDRRYVETAVEVSVEFGKPVLVATELAIADPANAAVAAMREAGRFCFPSADRAVIALDRLNRLQSWRERRGLPPFGS
jgi:acetyltransferase